MSRASSQRGQASVELVLVLPVVVLVCLAVWQAVVAGQAAWLAGSAARAASRASALGLNAAAAARSVLPASLERGLTVTRQRGGAVRVVVAIPVVLLGVRLGGVGATARFEPQRS